MTFDLMHSSGASITRTTGFIGSEQNAWHSRSLSTTVHLNAGESVWIEHRNSTSGVGSFYPQRSTFSGHLVYAD